MMIPQKPTEQRITLRNIFLQVLEQFNLEKGLGYTIKALTLFPGRAIKEYLFEDRKKFMRPFQFLLLMTAIATFLTHFVLPAGDEILKELHESPEWEAIPLAIRPAIEFLSVYSQKYFNIFYLGTLPISSLATYWIFKKHRLYFAEHLVLNTFIFSYQTIFYIITLPLLNFSQGISIILISLTFVYAGYAFIQLFQLTILQGILKSILIFLLSQLLTLIVSIIFFLLFIMFSPL